jgi:SAM-dependent methyltransferase
MVTPAYDLMGIDYSDVRRADPRIEAAIWRYLDEARSVLNVGAGAGSYEPRDREVIAVEPSQVMIDQRPAGAAPAIRGTAESLPLEDRSVDAAMGVFTLHHWEDWAKGLAEVQRVTRHRIVFLTLDLDVTAEMWLCRDYLPEIIENDRKTFPTIADLESALPFVQVEVVPVSVDCTDGFCIALWGRPESYLDPRVRQSSSIWHLLPDSVVAPALARLQGDLASGEWDRRYGELRTRPSLDVGLRLVTATISDAADASLGREPS